MNPELEIQEGIYNEISELLSRADTVDKASAYIATYLQSKIGLGVIDTYDYTIIDLSANGFQANIEFSFTWNVAQTCNMLVYPNRSPAKAFDQAMSII